MHKLEHFTKDGVPSLLRTATETATAAAAATVNASYRSKMKNPTICTYTQPINGTHFGHSRSGDRVSARESKARGAEIA